MLDKTNYTTRTDLTSDELETLIRIRTALETGEIPATQFHMHISWNWARRDCDSVGCIGGWMGHFLQRSVMHEEKFHALFYPHEWIMDVATPAQGIQAITNFLHKKQPWAFMGLKKNYQG